MPWKLIGWSRNKSPYWFKILHIITHTRQWHVPSHFSGWAGDKRVSKTCRALQVMNFTTNKIWFAILNYDRRISTHGIIGECLFQKWISSMLKVYCSFFWQGSVGMGPSKMLIDNATCPFYLAQNCDMIGKCPTTREFHDCIQVISQNVIQHAFVFLLFDLHWILINHYPLINHPHCITFGLHVLYSFFPDQANICTTYSLCQKKHVNPNNWVILFFPEPSSLTFSWLQVSYQWLQTLGLQNASTDWFNKKLYLY